MPGAGSLLSANHVYRIAKPDGLTNGHFLGGLFFQQIFGLPGIEFDARKFEYIGAPLADSPVCLLMKATGVDSMEKWLASKTPVKMAGNAPGAVTDDVPKTLKAALGLPVQVVSGYKGSADMRLAAEGGEVGGICVGWDAVRTTWRKNVESNEAKVVVQVLPNPHADLPKIPLAINYAKSEEARQLIAVGVHSKSTIYRPYVLPPATPKRTLELYYTPAVNKNARVTQNAFPRNSDNKPTIINVDLRVYKDFEISSTVLTVFFRVFNLLDFDNAVNLYTDTGDPFFTFAKLEAEKNIPPEYFDQTINNDLDHFYTNPTYFSEPRRVEFGLGLNF